MIKEEGSIIPEKKKLNSSPERPRRFWVSTNLLFNVHRELVSRGKDKPGVKPISYLYLSAEFKNE
jgi:hypothetical protein